MPTSAKKVPETLAIGCDVGGTSTRLALVDTDTGRIVEARRHPSQAGDYRAGLAALVVDLYALRKVARRKVPIGIAIAAQLDPLRRKALVSPNLQWWNAPIADDLEAALGGVIAIENDVRGAAHGELRFGALRGVTGTAASVFWGSGIGGAVIACGQVQAGSLSIAGEVGHMTYEAGGIACGCGKRGCYEAYIGGHALTRRMRRRGIEGRTTRDLFTAARRGERKAKKLVDEALAIMGQHVGNLATLIDPEAIVIGGSIGLTAFSALQQAVRPHLLVVRRGKLRLVRAALGDNSGVLGAAALASAQA
ncbi:MAG: ROK family protein [Deltaproteobacteria bacterium]|nr:ROK family protein [Deltaproteobacteria bacterium]